MDSRVKNIVGCRFGFWTVKSYFDRHKTHTRWLCVCDCGSEKIVIGDSLKKGLSKSCGCKQYELASSKNTKHGMASTPTYKSWHAMIQRTQGKGGHESYVLRNISVCKEWFVFENFVADMGLRPKGKTLDRINNSQGYSKENCRWATSLQQSNNRHNTIFVVVNDEKLSLSEACKKYNIGISCARHRLNRGMSHQETFTQPNMNMRSRDAL